MNVCSSDSGYIGAVIHQRQPIPLRIESGWILRKLLCNGSGDIHKMFAADSVGPKLIHR